jgi:hypothetical protein
MRLRSPHELSPCLTMPGSKPSLPVAALSTPYGDIDALIDSGALGNSMPLAAVKARGLLITPSHTVVNVGDNRCVPAAGKTTVKINLGAHTVTENVILCILTS